MSDKNIDSGSEKLNAELAMIRELKERIYGKQDLTDSELDSVKKCAFCDGTKELILYKNNYICQECLTDIRS
ncbi:hypothetical protein [Halanaerobium salsuginis]|jgi:hypothetical protein|nr:hypothetical protein [Halanaerobium salsuginis]